MAWLLTLLLLQMTQGAPEINLKTSSTSTPTGLQNPCLKSGCRVGEEPACCFVAACYERRKHLCSWMSGYLGNSCPEPGNLPNGNWSCSLQDQATSGASFPDANSTVFQAVECQLECFAGYQTNKNGLIRCVNGSYVPNKPSELHCEEATTTTTTTTTTSSIALSDNSGYSLAEEHQLVRGTLLTTLPTVGKEWRITLQFRPTEITEPIMNISETTKYRTEPTKYRTEPTEYRTEPTEYRTEPTEYRTEPTEYRTEPTEYRTEPTEYTAEPIEGWTSILHLTTGLNSGEHGARIPAIFAHKDEGIRIWSSVNEKSNYSQELEQVPPGEWTGVEVGQREEDGTHSFYISIHGKEVHSVRNNQPREFYDVKVYASDPWHAAQPGLIKLLTIESKLEDCGVKMHWADGTCITSCREDCLATTQGLGETTIIILAASGVAILLALVVILAAILGPPYMKKRRADRIVKVEVNNEYGNYYSVTGGKMATNMEVKDHNLEYEATPKEDKENEYDDMKENEYVYENIRPSSRKHNH